MQTNEFPSQTGSCLQKCRTRKPRRRECWWTSRIVLQWAIVDQRLFYFYKSQSKMFVKASKIFLRSDKKDNQLSQTSHFWAKNKFFRSFFDGLAIASEFYESLQTGKSCFSALCVHCDFQTNVIYMVKGLRTCNRLRAEENVHSKWLT